MLFKSVFRPKNIQKNINTFFQSTTCSISNVMVPSGLSYVTIEHITQSQYKKMPWKNGLGTTTEIAISSPSSIPTVSFEWRISKAQVSSNGPFSIFPNIDRCLIVLPGGGSGIVMDSKSEDGVITKHCLLPLQPVNMHIYILL